MEDESAHKTSKVMSVILAGVSCLLIFIASSRCSSSNNDAVQDGNSSAQNVLSDSDTAQSRSAAYKGVYYHLNKAPTEDDPAVAYAEIKDIYSRNTSEREQVVELVSAFFIDKSVAMWHVDLLCYFADEGHPAAVVRLKELSYVSEIHDGQTLWQVLQAEIGTLPRINSNMTAWRGLVARDDNAVSGLDPRSMG